ncbi:MAG: PQQ-binding-like beta-propeller repeat protein [Planctomycetota bacterium]|nr:PQQ-binding-like beta-propeller repeat protein [Planctomycetota bacterium]
MLPVLLVAFGCAAGTPDDLLITIKTSGIGRQKITAKEKSNRPTWPQWRGPTRDAKCSGEKWPAAVNEKTLKRLWKAKLGPSYSGPIAGSDTVYTTETADSKSEIVHAYDRDTGKELWKAEWPGAMKVPFFARSNGSWIRSTPALDGDNLYVAGMRDVLVCLDAKTGKKKWLVDFPKKAGTPLPAFGFVCSPLVTDDALYVQAAASFLKLDKETGEIIWKSLGDGGGMWGSAFSSPAIATLAGREQVVVQTRTKLAGIDLVKGSVLWSEEVQAFRGMNILSPSFQGDSIFTSTYGGKTMVLDISEKDNKLQARRSWDHPTQGYMSSPVLIGGHAYVHLKNQRVTCFELATGEKKWTTTERFGKYWSMISQKDRILALDQKGVLYLIRATPEKFDLLSSFKVSESDTWAHLAIAGDQLFIRERDGLSAWKWSEASTP